MAEYIIHRQPTVSAVQSMPGELSCPICQFCAEAPVDITLEQPDETDVCAAHGPLLSWVIRSFEEEIAYMEWQGLNYFKEKRYSLWFRQWREDLSIGYVDYKDYTHFSRILLLSKPEDEDKPGICKQNLDPKWVDLQIARRWMDFCIKEHGSTCSDILNLHSCPPAYLIDTKRDCILQPDKKELDYVALSYRWGSQAGFRTDKASVAALMDEGSLRRTEGIPPAIHHAMHIVRSIGERYLWVDSVCLVSDDEDHLNEQLQMMGSIYACAKLTIVATDGDAWDGLHGIRDAPGAPGKSRDLSNTFLYPNGVQITVRDHPPWSQTSGSVSEYFRRGWTYQEYFLSKRRLTFSKKQMHWKCSIATWHEDRPDAQDRAMDGQSFRYTNGPHAKPDLNELARMVAEYQMRDFTRPDDALPGFAGLLKILTRTFEGGFLCGHPETWFDASLMWNCDFKNGWRDGHSRKPTLERRKVSRQPSTLPGAVLPSWAWIGWKGTLLRFLDDEEDFELFHSLIPHIIWQFVTTPVTEWYSHETPTSIRRRIQSFPQFLNADGSLGDNYQGWLVDTYDPNRHYSRVNEDEQSKIMGKRVYHHPAIVPHTYFWAPFPKSSDGQGASTCAREQYQYISCHTKRGWFGVMSASGDRKPFGAPETRCTIPFDAQAALMDDQGRVCGWLQLPPSDDIALMLERSHHDYDGNDKALARCISELKIELVAVCQRRRSCPCWPWTDGGCSCGEDFYGVLYVEWVDGVAYRRGCGYVKKEMWERH